MENVPCSSLIINGFENYDYCDSYSKKVSDAGNIKYRLNRI